MTKLRGKVINRPSTTRLGNGEKWGPEPKISVSESLCLTAVQDTPARAPANLLLTPSQPGAWGCALCHLLTPSTCQGKGRPWRTRGISPRESELCRPVASAVRASALLFVPGPSFPFAGDSLCQCVSAARRRQASPVTSRRQRKSKTEEVGSPLPGKCGESFEWVEEAGRQPRAVGGTSSDARPACWEAGVRVVTASRRPSGQSPEPGQRPLLPRGSRRRS